MTNNEQTSEFDVLSIRKDFPALDQKLNDEPLAYLDNAATTQKPLMVIDAISDFYKHDNANVHRSVHGLSVRATQLFEAARDKVKRFINAKSSHECIFVRGTTEAINLVAQSFVAPRIMVGEEILLTTMEHHSNIVPWQMICKKTGAILNVANINLDGEIDLEDFERKLSDNTKFVAVSHVSNSLGTVNPIKKIVEMAHAHGALVLVDGAQAPIHMQVDVQDLGCDFYAFSGHKMFGPTGIGVLWGKENLLDISAPYQGGGEMINYVTFESTDYAALPFKFEAGTPNVAGAIGLGAAIDYIQSLDIKSVRNYEKHLLLYATEKIKSLKGFNLVGTAKHKAPIISFVHGKIHPHDIGTILDSEGIAIRTGHHCTMPLMDFYEIPATSRISLALYNTIEEIDRAVYALNKVKEVFK